MTKKRRQEPVRRENLVEPGGVECYEIRIVHWFDENAKEYDSWEITDPYGNDIDFADVHLGTMMRVMMKATGQSLSG